MGERALELKEEALRREEKKQLETDKKKELEELLQTGRRECMLASRSAKRLSTGLGVPPARTGWARGVSIGKCLSTGRLLKKIKK